MNWWSSENPRTAGDNWWEKMVNQGNGYPYARICFVAHPRGTHSLREFYRILRSGAVVVLEESGQNPKTAEFHLLIGAANPF